MKLKKIPRQVFILGLISFFTDFASEMLYPVTPLFLTSMLGASMLTVGIIEGIAEVTAGLLKGYFGGLSDKLGKRSIFVQIGYTVSSIVKPLPGIIPNIWTVLFSRTSDRMGKGIRTAPRDALLSFFSKGRSGAIFGFHRGMDTFGAVVGPLAALALLAYFPGDYALIFIAAIIPSVFAVYFTFRVKDPPARRESVKKKIYKEFWASASKEYKTLLILLTIFSLVNSSDVFLILKSKEISSSDSMAILGYVFYNFFYAVFSYPMGLMSDRFSKRKIFIFGLLIFSLTYSGFALIDNSYIIWLLFLFYGLFSASTEGVAKAWISDLTREEFRGTAIGLLTMATSFGVMLGSIFTGILWDTYGSVVPFLLSSAVSVVVAISLIFFRK